MIALLLVGTCGSRGDVVLGGGGHFITEQGLEWLSEVEVDVFLGHLYARK
ncbi:hypothetical protein [Mycobacterium saskatchewanense]|nr:hypothetical protein [Mycobacterium saskatchewanense]